MAKDQNVEKKRQTMRFTDAELSLIKNTFAENDELLKAMRKVFLQMPLDVIDKSLLAVFASTDLMAVVRKAWLPTLDPDAPFHQLIDLLITVDIKEKTPEEARPHIDARLLVIDYLEQQLQVLSTLDEEATPIRFASLADVRTANDDEMYVKLTARNTIIGHNEMQLDQMRILAGFKDETPEQTQKRLRQDSSR